jgi:hypothetical protein
MKKCLLPIAFSLVLISGCQDWDEVVKSDPNVWETMTYINRPNAANIKIKNIYLSEGSWDVVYSTVSYVVTIYKAPSFNKGSRVCLSLLDADGFQIAERNIGHVVPKFVGTLKGEFSMPYKDRQRVCGAEVIYYELND